MSHAKTPGRSWQLTVCFAAALAVGIMLPGIAHAGSVVIAPSKSQLRLESGARGAFKVDVSNTTTMAMSVAVRPWDFARDEAGNVHPIGKADASRFNGCSAWVTPSPSNPRTVSPGKTSSFDFALQVPGGLNDGTRYCYLEFRSSVASPTQTGTQGAYGINAPVVYAMNALLLVQVGEPATSTVLAYKQDVSVGSLQVKRFNLDGRVQIGAPIQNAGTIHSNLTEGSGFQVWHDGALRAKIPLQEYTLLPESTILVPAEWTTNAPVGKYKVRFVGAVGEAGATRASQALLAEQTFWVVRPWVIAVAIGAASAIIILAFLFFKRFKIRLAPRAEE